MTERDLREYGVCCRRMNIARAKLEEFDATLFACRAPEYDGMPFSDSAVSPDAVAGLLDVRAKLLEEVRQCSEALRRAFEKLRSVEQCLNEREREFFLLFYFEGCDMRTVCERLFITKSTGYNTMRRIRKKAEGVRMGL